MKTPRVFPLPFSSLLFPVPANLHGGPQGADVSPEHHCFPPSVSFRQAFFSPDQTLIFSPPRMVTSRGHVRRRSEGESIIRSVFFSYLFSTSLLLQVNLSPPSLLSGFLRTRQRSGFFDPSAFYALLFLGWPWPSCMWAGLARFSPPPLGAANHGVLLPLLGHNLLLDQIGQVFAL